MGGLGPMIGQYGYFSKFAGKAIEDPRPKERYITESRRLLGVLEQQLTKTEFIAGDQYTIADIAIFPWLRGAQEVYNASDDFQMPEFTHTMTYLDRCLQRPAVQRGLIVPPRQ
jgi:GST-like protein